MKKVKSVNDYIAQSEAWKNELTALRDILRSKDLEETIKWGAPCYVANGRNVIGMAAFKTYFGLWFHQGVHLKDKAGVLINAQEGKTKELRQWRMAGAAEIKPRLLNQYIDEAIEIANAPDTAPKKTKAPTLSVPAELKTALSQNKKANTAFAALTPGRRREYADYISDAKRPATKQNRIEKILPMIIAGGGLNDKYR